MVGFGVGGLVSYVCRSELNTFLFVTTCRGFLQLVVTIVLIGIYTPLALPMLVPIMLLFYWLYVYFQTTVREIKRLDSLSRSPVYGSINEALNGLATIRAFGAEKRLIARHSQFVNDNVVMSLANQSMNR